LKSSSYKYIRQFCCSTTSTYEKGRKGSEPNHLVTQSHLTTVY
jgi:hypothetical protein